jgi:glycerophosphoryl diester phosphodiesterase
MLLCASVFAADRRIAVIAHRGEHLSHPENTLEAFQGAINAGADFFELDVRTSVDGKLVLMHDATVDRMTGAKGEIAQMSFDAIRKLDVRGSQIPTFEEALSLARGKIGVYVDCKRIAPPDLVGAIVQARMTANVVIYGSSGFLKQVRALYPELKVMPEAGSAAQLTKLLETLRPRVVAFDAKDFEDPVIDLARKASADIYVDRLGNADSESSWQNAIDRGATGIQTDHPAELVAYLKSKGYR